MRFLLSGLVIAAVAVTVVAVAALGGNRETQEPVAPDNDRPADAPGAAAPAGPRVVVVWSAEDLRRAARRLARAAWVERATLLGRGTALLKTARAGFAIPLDVVTVEPRAYAAFLGDTEARRVRALRRGEALLSETSARLRRARTGSRLTLVGGRRLRVAGVVPDSAAQAAEIVVRADEPRVPAQPRTAVATLRSPNVGAAQVARRAGGGARARLVDDRPRRSGGPARPAELKARFGEPAVALPFGRDWVRLDPRFVRRHIVSRRVPVLGTVTCHRAMLPALRAAMAELQRRGLAPLVDPADYAGCYAPRRIRPGGPLSLHAWGLAVDLNASRNPFGGRSDQDRRLVQTMKRHGFTWGGEWPSVRDPMHFEFRGR